MLNVGIKMWAASSLGVRFFNEQAATARSGRPKRNPCELMRRTQTSHGLQVAFIHLETREGSQESDR